jgi:hypothetical protein
VGAGGRAGRGRWWPAGWGDVVDLYVGFLGVDELVAAVGVFGDYVLFLDGWFLLVLGRWVCLLGRRCRNVWMEGWVAGGIEGIEGMGGVV